MSVDPDRTCSRYHCAADPCYIHREDEEPVYLEKDPGHDDPVCGDCGEVMEMKVSAGGGSLRYWRRQYECPTCDHVVIVDQVPPQRTITAFADGGAHGE